MFINVNCEKIEVSTYLIYRKGAIMKTIAHILTLSLMLLGFSALIGCEQTVSGFGKDMQHNGQELQKSMDS